MNVSIGPLAFQLAHVLLLACASLAIAVGWLVGRKRQIGISDVMVDMALVAVLTGRIVFVAIWFSAYQDSPWSVFDIRDGGLEMWSPPQAVPVISFMGMDGGLTKLSSQADGQAMVVNMWATWCPPCQQEMPALARAQALHTDVRFVFVNQGESLDVVRRYLRRIPFHLEHVLVDEGNLLGKAMDSTALPMTLIYGANGQLVYSHQGLISEAVLAMQLERCLPDTPLTYQSV